LRAVTVGQIPRHLQMGGTRTAARSLRQPAMREFWVVLLVCWLAFLALLPLWAIWALVRPALSPRNCLSTAANDFPIGARAVLARLHLGQLRGQAPKLIGQLAAEQSVIALAQRGPASELAGPAQARKADGVTSLAFAYAKRCAAETQCRCRVKSSVADDLVL
jgi:hypothetical protein